MSKEGCGLEAPSLVRGTGGFPHPERGRRDSGRPLGQRLKGLPPPGSGSPGWVVALCSRVSGAPVTCKLAQKAHTAAPASRVRAGPRAVCSFKRPGLGDLASGTSAVTTRIHLRL